MHAWLGSRPRIRKTVWLLLIGVALLAILRLVPKKALRQQAVYSAAFYSSEAELLRLTLASDQQYRLWVPLQEIDPRFVEAVQLYEDRWFYWHPGINPASLIRGAISTWSGQTRRGGSTLTMQLARRLYRIDSSQPAGKLRQIAHAVALELFYGKREILEAYLNLAPYGGNIEGVGAASLIYFGKRTQDLLLPESLALAVIPQNPNRRGNEAWSRTLGEARNRLWSKWLARHPQDDGAATQAAINLPLRLRSPKELPFAAPHAVQTLLTQMPAAQTTLSLSAPMQRTVERSISQYLENHKSLGLRNAAALLVDTQSMQVRAWVGSANWFDDSIDGQVNATTAKRSPGSTLKPFIYALALDQGLLHPASILKDAPTSFGTYSPENFDGRFEGPISATNALIRSRNIPAVAVSSRIQNPNLYQFLKQSGVSRMASENHYGLALTLGGGELSMEELLTLYAMLANKGELKSLAYTTTPTEGAKGLQLLSPEAAFVTLDMLRNNPRPDTGRRAFPRVAWKTGTSWGFRDAWTAGVFGRYAMVVWLGNFDSTSNAALVGIQTAAPLFFQIVDSLRAQGLDAGELADTLPPNLSRVKVCAASGDLPNEFCKDLAETWYIPGKSPIKLSTLHRAVQIDTRTGMAVCSPGPNTRLEVFEYWGSDMLQLFAQAGMPRRVPPQPARCGNLNKLEVAGDGPRIVSPLEGASYILRIKYPTPLSLKANAARQGLIHWFSDSAYLGAVEAGNELSWQPTQAGRFTLTSVDERGQSDARAVSVEFVP